MAEMEEIYQKIPLKDIPWNMEDPPEVLVDLVERGDFNPERIIDLGCGAGNYAVYLAGKGFDVTGVDISPTAIKHAKDNAGKKGVKCDFMAADLLGDIDIDETFDFAYDWEVLHHIFPEQREKYITNVQKALKRGARYLSVCFSEKSPQFGGEGKYRKTPIGTELYFSSEDEIRELFERYFKILELKTIEVKGKFAPHLAIYALAEKK